MLDGGIDMGEVIVITSGKGGVGKTTTTATLVQLCLLEKERWILILALEIYGMFRVE